MVGVLNTSLTLTTIYILISGLGLHHVLSNFLGYSAGIMVSFTLNRCFTFTASGKYGPQFAGFLLTFGVSYILSLLALLGLVELKFLPYWLATVTSLGIYTIASFLLNKYFVFSQRSPNSALQHPL